jgi:hypothetical protein
MFNKEIFIDLELVFLAIKERRFAKRVTKRLLQSYSAVSAEKPDLSNQALYREVLLHTQQVDPPDVGRVLKQAEDSVDAWTAYGREGLGLREVAHFFVMTQHQAAGHKGTVVSFGEIVNSLIPENL